MYVIAMSYYNYVHMYIDITYIYAYSGTSIIQTAFVPVQFKICSDNWIAQISEISDHT